MSNPTDTNQASEDELRRYHLSGCAKYETLRGIYPNDRRLTGSPCSCGIETLIRTEKLKLLAEVRERVIGENNSEDSKRFDSDTGACDGCDWFIEDGSDVCPCVLKNRLREVQRTELTKLEAELWKGGLTNG